MFLLSVLEHGWAGYHFRVCRLNLLLRRLCSFLIVRIVLSKNMIMVKRSRAKGWQHAKLSGHQNEDLIAEGDKSFKNNNYDAAVKHYQDALQLLEG